VDHLDAGEDDLGIRHRLEAEHGPNAAFDAPVILFDPIVAILAFADAYGLQGFVRSLSQTVFSIAGNDCFTIGRAAVDDDAVRPSMVFQGLPQEAFGRQQITVFAEKEFDCVAEAVDGAVKVHPMAANLDISLVHMPLARDGPLAFVETPQKLGARSERPNDGRWSGRPSGLARSSSLRDRAGSDCRLDTTARTAGSPIDRNAGL